MSEVENNIANQSSCLCPVCPVQEASGCVNQKKEENWIDIRKNVIGAILEEYADHPETYEMPIDELVRNPVGRKDGAEKIRQEDMIELYCAIGKSDCHDLFNNNPCVCPDCSVWEGKYLTSVYFCRHGAAEDLEEAA